MASSSQQSPESSRPHPHLPLKVSSQQPLESPRPHPHLSLKVFVMDLDISSEEDEAQIEDY